MSGMAEEDDRTWAEKRIDARRAERGLPEKGSDTTGRLITGALLGLVGLWLVLAGSGAGIVIGVIALAGGGYQLLTAAIAQGVKEGRSDG